MNVFFRTMLRVLILLICLYGAECSSQAIEEEQIRAKSFLQQLDQKSSERVVRLNVAEWAYASNITDENLKNLVSINISHNIF